MPATVLTALADALASEPGRPLVTFYDGSTGERIELSVVTFTNWVNKIANLFADELMLDPGDTVHVELPSHWQVGVILLGAWTAGLRVSVGPPTEDVDVRVVGPAAREAEAQVPGQVLACSLRPMGGPFLEPLPDGWLDFAREVPPQPDALMSPVAIGSDDVALTASTGTSTHAALVEQAARTAESLGLGVGGRLITDANPGSIDGLMAALLSPVLMGASVVLVTNCDSEQRAKIEAQEQVTARFLLRS